MCPWSLRDLGTVIKDVQTYWTSPFLNDSFKLLSCGTVNVMKHVKSVKHIITCVYVCTVCMYVCSIQFNSIDVFTFICIMNYYSKYKYIIFAEGVCILYGLVYKFITYYRIYSTDLSEYSTINLLFQGLHQRIMNSIKMNSYPTGIASMEVLSYVIIYISLHHKNKKKKVKL